ncbi:MAG: apolipoprotein N-acyltransferase [Treponema sp.]|nr:apolipoprotein N-acyltransferase [Treponema sp.]
MMKPLNNQLPQTTQTRTFGTHTNKREKIFLTLIDLGLILLAAVLFTVSFPNPIFAHGLPFVAWFAFIPFLIVINKYDILACAGWGAIYGFASYSLFNYWMGNFHPLAAIITPSVFLIYLAAVFALLKLAVKIFPNHGYILQWLIWIAYEYLRTQGFLGYSYGVIGYSQWRVLPIIQIASLTGVWGVSALVAFPSFYIVKMFAVKKFSITAIIWLCAIIAALIFGFINMKDYSDFPAARIALIQHNTDPWEASRSPQPWQKIEAYQKDLSKLIRLSDEAIAGNEDTQLVVWPETAIIPRIYWHTRYRETQEAWIVVRDLMEYLSKQEIPFLIGNDDGRMDAAKNPNAQERHRVDYNAAMLFENGVNTAVYRKMHLVPFTEHFPYKKIFPRFYEWLETQDTHFWEKGEEETIFKLQDFSFAAPICFEDTFGYISRKFVKRGADVIVNMSNDAWSKSLSAQNQHLSMAVFRAIENSRSMVRSTASGQTCAIDPSGRLLSVAPPFAEVWLNITVPLLRTNTFYTSNGDFAGVFFTAAVIVLLLFGAARCIMRKLRSRGKTP